MTADREFGEDGTRIFNGILTGNPVGDTKYLVAAPVSMKPMVLRFIEQEIIAAREGRPAAITVKINSLTDKDVIDKLTEASMAGVKIRMIIRGICCLRVGVPGIPTTSRSSASSGGSSSIRASTCSARPSAAGCTSPPPIS